MRIIIALVLLTGCGVPIYTIKPDPIVAHSEIGRGHAVNIRVIEGPGIKYVDSFREVRIESRQRLSDVLNTAIATGLIKKGFAISGAAERTLTIEVHRTGVSIRSGFWTNAEKFETAISASVNDDKQFSRVYQSRQQRRTAINPKLEEGITDSITDVLTQLLDDQDLMEVLRT